MKPFVMILKQVSCQYMTWPISSFSLLTIGFSFFDLVSRSLCFLPSWHCFLSFFSADSLSKVWPRTSFPDPFRSRWSCWSSRGCPRTRDSRSTPGWGSWRPRPRSPPIRGSSILPWGWDRVIQVGFCSFAISLRGQVLNPFGLTVSSLSVVWPKVTWPFLTTENLCFLPSWLFLSLKWNRDAALFNLAFWSDIKNGCPSPTKNYFYIDLGGYAERHLYIY